MKIFIPLFLVVLFIINCNNTNKPIDVEQNPYITRNKEGLKKRIVYYGDSKDIKLIYYVNNTNIKDSIQKEFYKSQSLKNETWYKNGDYLSSVDYYENGNKKQMDTFAIINGANYLNGQIIFDKNGEVISDSSSYIKLLYSSDTISLGDSIEIKLRYITSYDNGYISASYGEGIFNEKLEIPKKMGNFSKNMNAYYHPSKKGEKSISTKAVLESKNHTRTFFFTKTIVVL